MNHPAQDVVHEIEWMADMGLGFIDLTLEPPRAASWKVDRKAIGQALALHRMAVVGHTAFYLPIASGIEEIRRASLDELRRCVDVFAELGVRWMNVHPDRHAPMHDRAFFVHKNIATLAELGLHLDIGHANLLVVQSTVGELLKAYGARLRHVHLHDNKGGSADLHLPLGTGSVDVRGAVRELKALGYDGTITLEVFTPDRHHLTYSRDSLQRIWAEE